MEQHAGAPGTARSATGEAALRESEEPFRLLVESVQDYAIFLLDPDGRVASWNCGAERIKGYAAAEIVGWHFSVFYPPEDVARGKPARELEEAARVGRLEDEGWRVRRDGGHFWANVVITALRDEAGRLRGFAKVTRDLTERRRVEAERAELLARERAAALREEFLALAAHELRTPLTTVKGYAQLLARHLRRPAPDLAVLRQVNDHLELQLGRLDVLIAELLDVARLQQGRVAVRSMPTDLAALARDVLARFEHAPHLTARHQLVFEAPAPVIAAVDASRLDQVLTNLLSNALKYSPAGGEMRVRVRRVDDRAEIAVSDQGIGIAPEARAGLFQPFSRLAAANGVIEGVGLGLYLSAQIVERHGGMIRVESTPGRGSAFIARLPLTPPAESPW